MPKKSSTTTNERRYPTTSSPSQEGASTTSTVTSRLKSNSMPPLIEQPQSIDSPVVHGSYPMPFPTSDWHHDDTYDDGRTEYHQEDYNDNWDAPKESWGQSTFAGISSSNMNGNYDQDGRGLRYTWNNRPNKSSGTFFLIPLAFLVPFAILYCCARRATRSADDAEMNSTQQAQQPSTTIDAAINIEQAHFNGMQQLQQRSQRDNLELPVKRKSLLLAVFKKHEVCTTVTKESLDYQEEDKVSEPKEDIELDQSFGQVAHKKPDDRWSQIGSITVSLGNADYVRISATKSVPNCCAICLSCYKVGESIVWSLNPSCNHAFHFDCLSDWFTKTAQVGTPCPCCRQEFIV